MNFYSRKLFTVPDPDVSSLEFGVAGVSLHLPLFSTPPRLRRLIWKRIVKQPYLVWESANIYYWVLCFICLQIASKRSQPGNCIFGIVEEVNVVGVVCIRGDGIPGGRIQPDRHNPEVLRRNICGLRGGARSIRHPKNISSIHLTAIH